MLKEIIKNIFLKLGYEIKQGPSLEYYEEHRKIEKFINIIRANTMVSLTGLISLYNQAVYCEKHNVPGSYVECGVWKGGAIGLMALVNLKYGSKRRHIHLFDSFQEICEPDESVDGERAISEVKKWAKDGGTQGKLRPLTGIYDHKGGPGTVEENKSLLEQTIKYDKNYIHYHVGWFQQTMPVDSDKIGDIAILRLDSDYYASTKISLEYLFDKVVKGGFIIIDDYGAYDGCRKAVDEFFVKKNISAYLNYVSKDIRYLIKP